MVAREELFAQRTHGLTGRAEELMKQDAFWHVMLVDRDATKSCGHTEYWRGVAG